MSNLTTFLTGAGAGGAGSGLVFASATDTTQNFLLSKLVQGANVTLTHQNIGGNETIEISATGFIDSNLVIVSGDDTTAGNLETKLTGGTGVTFATNNPAGNENRQIDVATLYTADGTIDGVSRTFTGINNSEFLKIFFNTDLATFTSIAVLSVAPTEFFIQRIAGDGAGGVTGEQKIALGVVPGMTVTDTVQNKGFIYAADYSTQFTDRSLVDKAFVDAATAPAGANTEIQFNSSGSFGADPDFTWDGTTLAVVGNKSLQVAFSGGLSSLTMRNFPGTIVYQAFVIDGAGGDPTLFLTSPFGYVQILNAGKNVLFSEIGGELTATTGTGLNSIHSIAVSGTAEVDDVFYKAYALGDAVAVNSESLVMGWDDSAGEFHIDTQAAGTGTQRNLRFLQPLAIFGANGSASIVDIIGNIRMTVSSANGNNNFDMRTFNQVRAYLIEVNDQGFGNDPIMTQLMPFGMRETLNAGKVTDIQERGGERSYEWTAGANPAFALSVSGVAQTDDLFFKVYNLGDASTANSESIRVGWDDSIGRFVLETAAAGTGVVRDLNLSANTIFAFGQSNFDPLTGSGDSLIDIGDNTATRLKIGFRVGSLPTNVPDGEVHLNGSGNLVLAAPSSSADKGIEFYTGTTTSTLRMKIAGNGSVAIGNISSPALADRFLVSATSSATNIIRTEQGIANTIWRHDNTQTASTSNTSQISNHLNVTTTGLVEATRIESSFTDIGAATNDSSITFYVRIANVLTAVATIDENGIVASPAGADTEIQFNNAGVLGASANFVFDGTTVTAPVFLGTALGGGSGAAIRAVSTSPGFELRETDATLDNKSWDIIASTETLRFRAVNDANSAANSYMEVQRTGIVIDSVTFPTGVAIGGVATPLNPLHVQSSGTSTFTSGLQFGILITDAIAPAIVFEDTGAAADKKIMRAAYFDENLVFASLNDVGTAGDVDNILIINRDGAVTVGAGDFTTAQGRFKSARQFNANTSTDVSARAEVYNHSAISGDITLTVNFTDMALASSSKLWEFAVKDISGALSATNRKIIIKTETITISSVAAGTSGSDFISIAIHNLAIGDTVVHTGFGAQPSYNGTFVVTDIVSTTRYEVAALTFVGTDGGEIVKAIEGAASIDITSDFGGVKLFSDGQNLFGAL